MWHILCFRLSLLLYSAATSELDGRGVYIFFCNLGGVANVRKSLENDKGQRSQIR